MRDAVTLARLKEVLHYDPVTGVWTWRKTLASAAPAGQRAGCINTHGYRVIKIDGVLYRSNRLAWLYQTSAWPINEVDHENLDKTCDAWSNLREATPAQNGANKGVSRKNTSGYKGVSWQKTEQKWRAYIQVGGRSRNLGAFDCPKKAHAAYCAAAKVSFGEFARTA